MNIFRIPCLQNLFWSRHWLSEHYYRLPFSGKLSKFKKASLLRDMQIMLVPCFYIAYLFTFDHFPNCLIESYTGENLFGYLQ